MSAAPSDRPRILTVGAYERDNFGDLLFLLVTEKYLPGTEIVAAAPFAADMTDLLDRKVVAFGDLLREQEFDAVWSVGGEIGGTTVESAYRMSMPPEIYAGYTDAPYARKREMLAESVNGAPIVAGYIPTPGAFPLNAGATTIVNSAGLTGVRSRPVHVRKEILDGLRRADAVSVRDTTSHDFLNSVGVDNTLVPDVVHAIGAIDPFDRDPDADNVVVQVSNGILRQVGRKRFAQALAESKHIDGLRIRLLLAGTATGHDSFEAMEQLAADIAGFAPSREVEIIADRRPMDLVDHIRRARVVLSSSLHVRIISASYGVPRVTVTRPKPTRYAAHWDAQMPYGIDVPDLDAAFGCALEIGGRDEVLEASRELTRLADSNVRSLAELVLTAATERTPAQREERATERITAYEPILAERLACEPHEHRIRGELDEAKRELRATRAELNATRRELDEVRAATLRRRARRVAGKVKRRVSRRG